MKVKMMATNSVMASYQEVIDVSTVPGKVGVFGFHTPDTLKPVQMLEGFYKQFRQFKYLGATVKVQPAATLPADPLSVSYEAGEVATDPRDLLNPIMVKGCHGETMNNALDVIFKDNPALGDSFDRVQYDFDTDAPIPAQIGDGMYYSALSDPSFRKYGVLQPFSMNNLHPLVHKIVGTMPIYPAQSDKGQLDHVYQGLGARDPDSEIPYYDPVKPNVGELLIPAGIRQFAGNYTSEYGEVPGTIFTSKMERLGWLDTVSRPQINSKTHVSFSVGSGGSVSPNVASGDYDPELETNMPYKYNSIPKLFMACMIMPPCYKTILTFRIVVTHRIAFRGFSTARYVLASDFSPASYTNALSDVATASVASASVDTINGDATAITDGVF